MHNIQDDFFTDITCQGLNGFRVKLHGRDRQTFLFDRHDYTILATGSDTQGVRNSCRDQGMIASHLETGRDVLEQPAGSRVDP